MISGTRWLTGAGICCNFKESKGIEPMTATLTVKTNNVPREVIMGQWLDGFGGLRPDSLYSKLRKQFDYLTEEEFDETEFFKYRGDWYSVGDFMRLDANSPIDNKRWDGYASDSYFSGVLMKYCYDGTVIVGTYFS